MRDFNYFRYNNKTTLDYGLKIEKWRDLDRPQRKFEEHNIPGRNGTLYDTGDVWEQDTVTYDMWVHSDATEPINVSGIGEVEITTGTPREIGITLSTLPEQEKTGTTILTAPTEVAGDGTVSYTDGVYIVTKEAEMPRYFSFTIYGAGTGYDTPMPGGGLYYVEGVPDDIGNGYNIYCNVQRSGQAWQTTIRNGQFYVQDGADKIRIFMDFEPGYDFAAKQIPVKIMPYDFPVTGENSANFTITHDGRTTPHSVPIGKTVYNAVIDTGAGTVQEWSKKTTLSDLTWGETTVRKKQGSSYVDVPVFYTSVSDIEWETENPGTVYSDRLYYGGLLEDSTFAFQMNKNYIYMQQGIEIDPGFLYIYNPDITLSELLTYYGDTEIIYPLHEPERTAIDPQTVVLQTGTSTITADGVIRVKADPVTTDKIIHDVIEWLAEPTEYTELTDSFDTGYYRDALLLDHTEITNYFGRDARMRVTFRTKPQHFLNSGKNIDLIWEQESGYRKATVTNPTNHSALPVIRLEGTGPSSYLKTTDRTNTATAIAEMQTLILPSGAGEYSDVLYKGVNELTQALNNEKIDYLNVTEGMVRTRSTESGWGVGLVIDAIPDTWYHVSYDGQQESSTLKGQIRLYGEAGNYIDYWNLTLDTEDHYKYIGEIYCTPQTRYIMLVLTTTEAGVIQLAQNIMVTPGHRSWHYRPYTDAYGLILRLGITDIRINRPFGYLKIDCEHHTITETYGSVNYMPYCQIIDTMKNQPTRLPDLHPGENEILINKDSTTGLTDILVNSRFWRL